MKEEMWWLILQRKRTLRGHCRQFYANGFNYKYEIDKFSEENRLTKTDSRWNRMYRNRIILYKINWNLIQSLPQTNEQTSPGPESFTGEFYQTFRK